MINQTEQKVNEWISFLLPFILGIYSKIMLRKAGSTTDLPDWGAIIQSDLQFFLLNVLKGQPLLPVNKT